MKARQVVAIVLWVLTGLSMLGAMISGNMVGANPLVWIGFFIPAIIGIVLWCTCNKNRVVNENYDTNIAKNCIGSSSKQVVTKRINYIDILNYISFFASIACYICIIISVFRSDIEYTKNDLDMSRLRDDMIYIKGIIPNSAWKRDAFIAGICSTATGFTSFVSSLFKKYRVRETIYIILLSISTIILLILVYNIL